MAQGHERVLQRRTTTRVHVDVAGRDRRHPQPPRQLRQLTVARPVVALERPLQLHAQPIRPEGGQQPPQRRLVVHAVVRASAQQHQPRRVLLQRLQGHRRRRLVLQPVVAMRARDDPAQVPPPHAVLHQQRHMPAVRQVHLDPVDGPQPQRLGRHRELHRARHAVVIHHRHGRMPGLHGSRRELGGRGGAVQEREGRVRVELDVGHEHMFACLSDAMSWRTRHVAALADLDDAYAKPIEARTSQGRVRACARLPTRAADESPAPRAGASVVDEHRHRRDPERGREADQRRDRPPDRSFPRGLNWRAHRTSRRRSRARATPAGTRPAASTPRPVAEHHPEARARNAPTRDHDERRSPRPGTRAGTRTGRSCERADAPAGDEAGRGSRSTPAEDGAERPAPRARAPTRRRRRASARRAPGRAPPTALQSRFPDRRGEPRTSRPTSSSVNTSQPSRRSARKVVAARSTSAATQHERQQAPR